MSNKDIQIGSGSVYLIPYTGTIPADNIIETESNRLGYVKDGAVIKYTSKYKDVKEYFSQEKYSFLVNEEASIRFSMMTWDANVLNKCIQSGSVTLTETERTIDVGGIDNAVASMYIVRFVHRDKAHRITIVGMNQAGIELNYQKSREVVVSVEFKANPIDGKLFSYREDLAEEPPSPTEAQPKDIRQGKIAGGIVGTMPDVASASLVKGATEMKIIPNTAGYIPLAGVTLSTDLGNANTADVAAGKTFTSANGVKLTGTGEGGAPFYEMQMAPYGTYGEYFSFKKSSPMDTNVIVGPNTLLKTPATNFGNAIASEVAPGKRFTSISGVNIAGTMPTVTSGTATVTSEGIDVEVNTGYVSGSIDISGNFGDAVPGDIISGKSATSTTGKKIDGSLVDKREETLNLSHYTIEDTATQFCYKSSGIPSVVSGSTGFLIPKSSFGDADASEVAEGKTFTSANGVRLTGTASGGGGAAKPKIYKSVHHGCFTNHNVTGFNTSQDSDSTLTLPEGKYVVINHWCNAQPNQSPYESAPVRDECIFGVVSGEADYNEIDEFHTKHFDSSQASSSYVGQASYVRVGFLECNSETIIVSHLKVGTHDVYGVAKNDTWYNSLIAIPVKSSTEIDDIINFNYTATDDRFSRSDVFFTQTNPIQIGEYLEVDIIACTTYPGNNIASYPYGFVKFYKDREALYNAAADDDLWAQMETYLYTRVGCPWDSSGNYGYNKIAMAKEGYINNYWQSMTANDIIGILHQKSVSHRPSITAGGLYVGAEGYFGNILIPLDKVITE